MLKHGQLDDIKTLQRVCEAEDSIQLKLNWDILRNRDQSENNDLLYYENGELAGFLGLYGFGSKVELCGMVKPEYRRKGIFTKLLKDALNLISERKYEEVLLNAPAGSVSAKAFLDRLPCDYSFSEHQMKWTETKLAFNEDVRLLPSTRDDLRTEVQLDVKCFGLSEADAKTYRERLRLEEARKFYMIEYEGKNVGKISVAHTDGEAWIYGFAVFPELQGKGIGRKALKNVIIQEKKLGYPIFLEVDAKNDYALQLYESCGFRAFQSQDYYRMR